jgi:hypothetical protein
MATFVDDYIAALTEWQANLTKEPMRTVLSVSPPLVPVIKWSQPVFESNGPVCYIKGHKNHLPGPNVFSKQTLCAAPAYSP